MVFVTESCLCQTTILLLRVWTTFTAPRWGREPLRQQGTPPPRPLALHYLLSAMLWLMFSVSSWPQSKENGSSDAMPFSLTVGKPDLPQVSRLHRAQGEAGYSPGSVYNICCDTQIIFVCSWQVLTVLWLGQCLSVW